MAEHRLEGEVIGVAFDGTGYGTDGAIWGGEVLVCDYAGFERRYHLRYMPLAGGDTAVREPWRAALAYLRDAGLRAGCAVARSRPSAGRPGTPILEAVDERRLRAVEQMIERRVQTVDTSSCGRLFDAVSAILGVCLENRYEAEAAMELEACAADGGPGIARPLRVRFVRRRNRFAADHSRAGRGSRSGESVASLAARFHSTLARAIAAACVHVRASDGLDRVCLSGGSFQNMRLLEATIAELERAGFEVYWHSEVPPNDGGIALGQAVIACAALG